MHQNVKVCTSIHQYALVGTNMYQYAPVCTSMHQYASSSTVMYQYAAGLTSMHQYVPVCNIWERGKYIHKYIYVQFLVEFPMQSTDPHLYLHMQFS